jgi:hypothetical protein
MFPQLVGDVHWKYECKLHRLQANSKFRSKLAAVPNSERASWVSSDRESGSIEVVFAKYDANFSSSRGSDDAL